MECNICFEEKQDCLLITCCKGKKWYSDCKIKTYHNYRTCPFCRTPFKIIEDEIVPSRPGSGIGRSTPVPTSVHIYNYDILYYPDSHLVA